MKKLILLAIGLFTVNTALASTSAIIDVQGLQASLKVQAKTTALNWKVGDFKKMKMEGFLRGEVHSYVRGVTDTMIDMVSDMNLSIVGRQMAEIKIDKNTGEIKEMKINGEVQEIPESNMEVISLEEARITVPAGTYDCVHAKIKNLDDNKITEAWINPEAIPMDGSLKQVSPTQFGNMTQTLTSFGRGN